MELTTLALLLGMAAPENAVSMQLVLELTGDAERRTVSYQCEGVDQPVPVTYINASPNFLAIMSVEGKQVLLVTVVSADGARYVSGPIEWWTHGTEAAFSDTRENSLPPLACSEISMTP